MAKVVPKRVRRRRSARTVRMSLLKIAKRVCKLSAKAGIDVGSVSARDLIDTIPGTVSIANGNVVREKPDAATIERRLRELEQHLLNTLAMQGR